jgi:hypothetical protein
MPRPKVKIKEAENMASAHKQAALSRPHNYWALELSLKLQEIIFN